MSSVQTLEIKEIVQAHEDRLYQAQLTSDVEVLDALISDDLIFTGPGGAVYTKADDLHLHQTGAMRVHTLVPLDTTIKVLAPTVAVVMVKAEITGTMGGQSANGTFTYLRVWVRQANGLWQVAAGSMAVVN